MGARGKSQEGTVVGFPRERARTSGPASERVEIARQIDAFDRWWPKARPEVRRHIRRVVRDEAKKGATRRHQADAEKVLALMNRLRPRLRGNLGTDYKPSSANLREIIGRLAEGYPLEQCRAVVVVMLRAARDPNDYFKADWWNPQTLFRASNFPKYLQRIGGDAP